MIALARWTDDDLPLLVALNAPELMTCPGGLETDEKVKARRIRD